MPLIPATLEAEFRKITARNQPGQRVNKITSQLINWAWWYVPVVPPRQEAISKKNK
jgi:hypothetical protein